MNDLIEQYATVEEAADAFMEESNERYAEAQYKYFQDTGKDLPKECWEDHPFVTYIPDIFLKDECSKLPAEVYANYYGYFKYALQEDVNKLIQINNQVIEISETLYFYNKNYEEFLKVKRRDLFLRYEFQLVVYDEIEKFRDYDHPLFGYPYGDRKIQVNSFTLIPNFFTIEDANS